MLVLKASVAPPHFCDLCQDAVVHCSLAVQARQAGGLLTAGNKVGAIPGNTASGILDSTQGSRCYSGKEQLQNAAEAVPDMVGGAVPDTTAADQPEPSKAI